MDVAELCCNDGNSSSFCGTFSKDSVLYSQVFLRSCFLVRVFFFFFKLKKVSHIGVVGWLE